MEFATGALGTLLPKLGELLLEEYDLQKGLKKGIEDLRDELLIIEAALVKVSNVPLDQLDPLVKIWANDVRELSYAIEDSLDSFMVRVEGLEPEKPHTFLGFIKKTCKKVTKLKIRREIASDIKDVKIQVKEVKERYDRYKDVIGNSSAATKVDPRLRALYNKVSNLVGIGEAMDEVKKMLSESYVVSQQNPRIISVVGFGGLGKTTLAKAVYDDLRTKFDCGNFIPVGQNPDTRKVLRDILLELDMELYRAAATMDERQLINQLQKFLAGKRYFIVIDDIWDISTWETIKCAFADSHPESRIIITTRNVDVATKAGGIYRMKPLSDDNSRMLFHTRTCGGEGVSQDNQTDEVVSKILNKCGGVPLAIITIASLLVDKPRADWFKVYDAIGFGNQDNDDVLNTRKILSFSYYDLQPYLKTCLLYLGMYPEDRFIRKQQLIWRWISEGFVPDNQGMGAFMLGEIYYNELVNKSMIRDIDEKGCYVHDLVLDLIYTMSMEVNFVTVQDVGKKQITCLPTGRSNKVHRLALHRAKVKHNSDIQMEHVRSFNAIMCTNSGMPPLSIFKVLRVLVIEDCDFLEGCDLEHIVKLVQLRYLGLVRTAVELPEGLGHDLKFLEILDVRGGLIRELPASVSELNNLRCLWASDGTIMKGEIGELTRLEELEISCAAECPNFVTEFGDLTNLRALRMRFGQVEETTWKGLAESLCDLHMIQYLSITIYNLWEISEFFEREWRVRVGSLEELAPSSRLRELLLEVLIIPRLPSWINYLCVPFLSHLRLNVEVVEAQDLQTLGRLPSLCILALLSWEEKRISYTFGSDDFQKLERLMTNIEITTEEGALPMLTALIYSVSAGRKDSLVPWNKACPLLEGVRCVLDCSNNGWKEVKAAEAVLQKAKRTHPNLFLDIERMNYDRKAARLIDALGSILHGLDRPDGEEITGDQRDVRRMIKSLETLLRHDDEPRVGMYGEQELRGIVTRLKSWLHDHAGAEQEYEADESVAPYSWACYSGSEDYADDDQEDVDDDCDPDSAKEAEGADNDVASSTGRQEGATGQP
ncbi:unnamed protein product [Alopecurus aequalis]